MESWLLEHHSWNKLSCIPKLREVRFELSQEIKVSPVLLETSSEPKGLLETTNDDNVVKVPRFKL